MQGWNIWSGLSKRHQLIHKLTCSPAHIPHCLTKILRVSKLIWHVTPSLNLRRNFHETYDFPPSDFNYISATHDGPGFVTLNRKLCSILYIYCMSVREIWRFITPWKIIFPRATPEFSNSSKAITYSFSLCLPVSFFVSFLIWKGFKMIFQ